MVLGHPGSTFFTDKSHTNVDMHILYNRPELSYNVIQHVKNMDSTLRVGFLTEEFGPG